MFFFVFKTFSLLRQFLQLLFCCFVNFTVRNIKEKVVFFNCIFHYTIF